MTKYLISAVFILLACNAATVPATFTPGPSVVLPTVVPYQTAPPSVFATSEPTPTSETVNWKCDSINGWLLSAHCGLNPWFIPVNSNSDLITKGTTATLSVEGPNGLIYRDIDYPGPTTLYSWEITTNGFDGQRIIRGLPPIIRHNGDGFEVNVTGLTGRIILRLEQVELFAIPGRYVVGFEMTPNLRVNDAVINNPAIMTKICRVRTYTGNTYDFPVQNAGHNQYRAVLDSAVYVISIEESLSIMLECGIDMLQPAFDGNVVFERFFVEAVPEDYGDSAIAIE